MKTKKLLIALIVAVFVVTLVSTAVSAGSTQRHRWEGVAIGVGAAVLGHAIYKAHKADQGPQVVYVEPDPAYERHHGREHRHGRWEWQEIRVPPTYEKTWNPGHYNRKGHWVTGHWITVPIMEGYWTRERVWVADYRDPY